MTPIGKTGMPELCLTTSHLTTIGKDLGEYGAKIKNERS